MRRGRVTRRVTTGDGEFAGLVRQCRLELDLTQDEFGAQVGSDGNTVSSWETGRKMPKPRRLAWLRNRIGEMIDAARRGDQSHAAAIPALPGNVADPAARYGSQKAAFPVRAEGEVEGLGRITFTGWIEVAPDEGGVT